MPNTQLFQANCLELNALTCENKGSVVTLVTLAYQFLQHFQLYLQLAPFSLFHLLLRTGQSMHVLQPGQVDMHNLAYA